VTLDKPMFLAAAFLILSSSEHTINDQNPLPNLIQMPDSFMLLIFVINLQFLLLFPYLFSGCQRELQHHLYIPRDVSGGSSRQGILF
jgi:hypothetical protein